MENKEITISDFLLFKYFQHFNFKKNINYIRKYTKIYDELNGPDRLKNVVFYFSLTFYLFMLIEVFHYARLSFVDLDVLQAVLNIDVVQSHSQNKRLNIGISTSVILLIYMNMKCYFDHPPKMMRQLKSILNNDPTVIFSYPYSYKGSNSTISVTSVINKWLLFTNVMTLGERLYCQKKTPSSNLY